MKNIIIAGVLLLFWNVTMAQKPHHGDQSPESRIEKMDKIVDLTDEQKTEITAIHNKYVAEIEAVKKDHDHERLKELHQQIKEEVDAVLTDEQLEKLAAHRESMHEQHESKRDSIHSVMKPKAKALRLEFENELSTDEKAIIQRVREMVAEHKEEQEVENEPHKGHGHKMNPIMDEALNQLRPIIDAHDSSLKVIAEELRSERMKMSGDSEQHGPKHMKKKMNESEMFHRHMVRFLLMDPNKE